MTKWTILSTYVLYILSTSSGFALDYWLSHNDPGVVSNNDCGIVSWVEGEAVIRRGFMTAEDAGLEAFPADRLHTGDVIIAGPDSAVEWQCGNNLILILGPDSQARLLGLRLFTDAEGRQVRRLDVALERGEIRAQARLNTNRPETALLVLPDADILLRQGDAAAGLVDGWSITAVSGQIEARVRREGVTGAPFAMVEASMLSQTGEEKLEANLLSMLRRRLAFTFERVSAALPPTPAVSTLLEAP